MTLSSSLRIVLIRPGSVSTHVGYFGDLMATFAEVAGAKPRPNLDSISLVPTLLGRTGQRRHEFLYWEFYEDGVSQAVLLEDRWKGIRLKNPRAPLQLYDLANDLGETTDVAAKEPNVAERLVRIMREAHVDNEQWKLPAP